MNTAIALDGGQNIGSVPEVNPVMFAKTLSADPTRKESLADSRTRLVGLVNDIFQANLEKRASSRMDAFRDTWKKNAIVRTAVGVALAGGAVAATASWAPVVAAGFVATRAILWAVGGYMAAEGLFDSFGPRLRSNKLDALLQKVETAKDIKELDPYIEKAMNDVELDHFEKCIHESKRRNERFNSIKKAVATTACAVLAIVWGSRMAEAAASIPHPSAPIVRSILDTSEGNTVTKDPTWTLSKTLTEDAANKTIPLPFPDGASGSQFVSPAPPPSPLHVEEVSKGSLHTVGKRTIEEVIADVSKDHPEQKCVTLEQCVRRMEGLKKWIPLNRSHLLTALNHEAAFMTRDPNGCIVGAMRELGCLKDWQTVDMVAKHLKTDQIRAILAKAYGIQDVVSQDKVATVAKAAAKTIAVASTESVSVAQSVTTEALAPLVEEVHATAPVSMGELPKMPTSVPVVGESEIAVSVSAPQWAPFASYKYLGPIAGGVAMFGAALGGFLLGRRKRGASSQESLMSWVRTHSLGNTSSSSVRSAQSSNTRIPSTPSPASSKASIPMDQSHGKTPASSNTSGTRGTSQSSTTQRTSTRPINSSIPKTSISPTIPSIKQTYGAVEDTQNRADSPVSRVNPIVAQPTRTSQTAPESSAPRATYSWRLLRMDQLEREAMQLPNDEKAMVLEGMIDCPDELRDNVSRIKIATNTFFKKFGFSSPETRLDDEFNGKIRYELKTIGGKYWVEFTQERGRLPKIRFVWMDGTEMGFSKSFEITSGACTNIAQFSRELSTLVVSLFEEAVVTREIKKQRDFAAVHTFEITHSDLARIYRQVESKTFTAGRIENETWWCWLQGVYGIKNGVLRFKNMNNPRMDELLVSPVSYTVRSDKQMEWLDRWLQTFERVSPSEERIIRKIENENGGRFWGEFTRFSGYQSILNWHKHPGWPFGPSGADISEAVTSGFPSSPTRGAWTWGIVNAISGIPASREENTLYLSKDEFGGERDYMITFWKLPRNERREVPVRIVTVQG